MPEKILKGKIPAQKHETFYQEFEDPLNAYNDISSDSENLIFWKFYSDFDVEKNGLFKWK